MSNSSQNHKRKGANTFKVMPLLLNNKINRLTYVSMKYISIYTISISVNVPRTACVQTDCRSNTWKLSPLRGQQEERMKDTERKSWLMESEGYNSLKWQNVRKKATSLIRAWNWNRTVYSFDAMKQRELCKQKGRPSECPHSYLWSDIKSQ